MALSVDTREKMNKYLKNLLPGAVNAVNNLSLEEIMKYKNPLIREMFQHNPKEFITFFIMERMERSFVTLMGKMIEKIVEILVEGQGGEIIGEKKNWKPYDLKFRLSDGKEYWLEIKSILDQNKSNKKSIEEYREIAIKQGKEFRLCVYYHTNLTSKNDYILIGKDFWSFVGGDPTTESVVFQLIKDTGREFSFLNLVQARTEMLLEEYTKKIN